MAPLRASAAALLVTMACVLASSLALAEDTKMVNPEKMAKKYLDATKVAPEDADNWYNLALAYKEMKKWAECADAALHVVALSPDNANAHFIAGEALQQTGKKKEAVEQFEAAAKGEGAPAAAHARLGDAYYDAGKYDEAIASYKAAIEKDETLEASLNDDLGAVYLKKGDVDRAVRYLNKTIEASPNDPAVHYNLGVTYRKMAEDNPEMLAKAGAAFSKASDLDPKDPKVALLAAEALFLADQNAGAKTYLDRYFKLDPEGKKTGAQMFDLAKAYQEELAK